MAWGVVFSAPVVPFLRDLRERYVASREGRGPLVAEAVLSAGEVLGLLLVLLASASWLAAGTYNPFIYFRF
jgi:alginate O-acetyltransferase complex protein AlgI